MAALKNLKGYRQNFLGKKHTVPLPKLKAELAEFVAPVKETEDNILRYKNYSVVQHSQRRFPIFSAANINGRTFKELRRKDIFKGGRDRWRNDPRLKRTHQWGSVLYKAPKSDFDKGHMTKREDVQWGRTANSAKTAARTTFYYPNAVPQYKKLNRQVWRSLEDYILHDETVLEHLKINLLTGPVLQANDPVFVTEVRGKEVRIPTLFWKVIYFAKHRKQLFKVGFLMGQENLLVENGIVFPKPIDREIEIPEELPFMDFDGKKTYQVNTALIETLAGLQFHDALDPMPEKKVSPLELEQFDVRGLGDSTPQLRIGGLYL